MQYPSFDQPMDYARMTELLDAMRYSLLAGGKRIRPLFLAGPQNSSDYAG